MFLVQTTLWVVQFSVLGYYSRCIYLSIKGTYFTKEDIYITDMFKYLIKFAIYSAIIQFLIYLLTQLSIRMN